MFILLFLLNIFLIIFFNKFSKLINLYDKPDNIRKLHKKNTPAIGGFLIFINLIIYFIFTQYEFHFLNIKPSYFDIYDFIIFFIFLTFFFLLGFYDDLFNLNTNLKLIIF